MQVFIFHIRRVAKKLEVIMECSMKMKINVKSYYPILKYLKMLMWDIEISKICTNI